MDSSVSPKDEIWFLRVCHHISNALYHQKITTAPYEVIGPPFVIIVISHGVVMLATTSVEVG
jgi:hypothetical protein